MEDKTQNKSGTELFRILIVDDSRATRVVLRTLMTEFGFDVTEAPDGTAALQTIGAKNPFKLLIVDWQMPGMTGVDFVRQFRAKYPEAASVPIIMNTIMEDADSIAQALEAGATDYVMKPFSRDVFASKLQVLGIKIK